MTDFRCVPIEDKRNDPKLIATLKKQSKLKSAAKAGHSPVLII